MKKLLTFSILGFFAVFIAILVEVNRPISTVAENVTSDEVYDNNGELLADNNGSKAQLNSKNNLPLENLDSISGRSIASEMETLGDLQEAESLRSISENSNIQPNNLNIANKSSNKKSNSKNKLNNRSKSNFANNQKNSTTSDSNEGDSSSTDITASASGRSTDSATQKSESVVQISEGATVSKEELDSSVFNVLSVSPKDSTVDVLVDGGVIELIFSYDLNCTSINSSSLVIKRNNVAVTGIYTCTKNTIKFETSEKKFKYSSVYTITTNKKLIDKKNRYVYPDFSSTFTTESGVASVAVGKNHTCVVVDEQVKCFGDNAFGQLALDSALVFEKGAVGSDMGSLLNGIKVDGNTIRAKKVFSGEKNSCAIDLNDKLYCWGDNSKDQLGTGVLSNTLPLEFDSIYIGSGKPIDVAIGSDHICILTDSSEVRCFGDNTKSQFKTLGAAVDFGFSIQPVKLEAGDNFTCALLSDGSVKCWGENNFGQLGVDNSRSYDEPVNAPVAIIPSNVVDITLGQNHACALYDDGGFVCWGNNSNGQLGLTNAIINNIGLRTSDMSTFASSKQYLVSGKKIVNIKAGGNNTCVFSEESKLFCFGENKFGQFGLGHTNVIDGLSAASETYFGSSSDAFISFEDDEYIYDVGPSHSCGYLETGDLVCLGRNDYGQLGSGTNTSQGGDPSYTGSDLSPAVVVDEYPTSFYINEGLSTSSKNINITLFWNDDLGYDEFIVTESNNCAGSTYDAAINSKLPAALSLLPFTLTSSGEGVKTIFVKLRNSITMETSSCLKREIIYYENSPSGSAISGPNVTSSLLNDYIITNNNSSEIALELGTCPAIYSGAYTDIKNIQEFSLADLADGPQTIRAFFNNSLGTECVATTTILDRTGPNCTFDSSFISDLTSINTKELINLKEYSCLENLPVTVTSELCKLEGPADAIAIFDWKNCDQVSDGYDLNSTDNSDGTYKYSVMAVDSLGNTSSEISHTWIKDTNKPTCNFNGVYPLSGNSNQTAENITFSCSDATTFTVSCTLDSVSVACDSLTSHSISSLSDGAHTFSVQATDSSALVSDVITMSWTVDTSSPVCSFSGATPTEASNVNAASAAMTFNCTDSTAVTYQCKLDTGSFGACSSVHNLSALSDGSHIFTVRGTDALGNSTDIVRTWKSDTAAPVCDITTAISGNRNNTSETINFSCSDANPMTIECSVNGGTTWGACSTSSSHTMTGLTDGAKTFDVRAKDAFYTSTTTDQSRSWNVDLTNPVCSFDYATTPVNNSNVNSNAASMKFSCADATAVTYECKLDAGSFASCTSVHALASLIDGSHTFSVKGTDSVGNTHTISTNWKSDTTAPTCTLSTALSGNKSATSEAFAFSCSDANAIVVECRKDGGAWSTCDSTTSHTLSGLTDGAHSFELRARDAFYSSVVNASVTRNWTVDTSVPVCSFSGATPTEASNVNSASAAMTFNCTDTTAVTYQCKLDTGSFGACSSVHNLSALSDGSHTFTVRGTDALGNSTDIVRTWKSDTAAPVCTISTSISGNRTNASETINYSCSDANAITRQCRVDGGAWITCASNTTITMGPTLSQGSHSFELRAVDAFYTSTIQSRTWVTDSVAPSCTKGTGPGAWINSNSQGFTYSCSDATSSISTYECQKDAGAWISCGSGTSYTWTSISEGAGKTFSVRATDASGLSSSPISWSFGADYTNPTGSISSSSKVSSTTRSIAFSTADSLSGVSTRQCRVNAGAWSSCSSSTSHTFTVSTPGVKTYDVLITDAAGNTNTITMSETVISGARTNTECTTVGGTVVSNICQFTSGSTAVCPGGWSQYSGYAEYAARSCGSAVNCNTSCTTGALAWTSSASQPSCSYQTGTWSGWSWSSYGWAASGSGPLLGGTISQNTAACPKSQNAHIDSAATYPYDADVASDYCAQSPNWTSDGKSATRCNKVSCALNCTSVTASVSCTARLSKIGCN